MRALGLAPQKAPKPLTLQKRINICCAQKQSTILIFKQDQLEQLNEDKIFLKEELGTAISELPENYRTAKAKLRDEYQPQISEINQTILNTKQEIGDLKTKLVDTGVDVGPAIYLARIFNTEIDTVVKWFIFILIFVFDPLAVSLVIAANVAFELGTPGKPNVEQKSTKRKRKFWEMYLDRERKQTDTNTVNEEEKTINQVDEKKIIPGEVEVT